MATVAFIGLGVMGAPMAGHLQTAGHDTRVYNRTAGTAAEWVSRYKGSSFATPAEAARVLNSREIYAALQQACRRVGLRMFKTFITNSVRFTESPHQRAPLVLTEPRHEGAAAYTEVAKEILDG